jgi:hypothetical protein
MPAPMVNGSSWWPAEETSRAIHVILNWEALLEK